MATIMPQPMRGMRAGLRVSQFPVRNLQCPMTNVRKSSILYAGIVSGGRSKFLR